MIVLGLLIFALGSVVAANAHSIEMIILGRALQGAGAVGSTLTALLADEIQERHRLRAMSVLGMTIGISFMLAMVIGPVVNAWEGLHGIFWLTTALACLGIVMLVTAIPGVSRRKQSKAAPLAQIKTILSMRELLRLDFGIFSLHAILTMLFISLPLVMAEQTSLIHREWVLYLLVLLISFMALS